jgi:hypothetical protein
MDGARLAPDDQVHSEAEEDRTLRCAACRTPVSHEDHVFSFPGKPSVQVFVNPAGFAFRVLCLREASVLVEGRPVPGFTWFPGYVWRFALCARGHFLGWRYDRVEGEGPVTFYGLDTERLTR